MKTKIIVKIYIYEYYNIKKKITIFFKLKGQYFELLTSPYYHYLYSLLFIINIKPSETFIFSFIF